MVAIDLSLVPAQHQETVRSALDAAFGRHGASSISIVTGGASGALTYRVDSADGPFLLRVETLWGPLRNPHQYDCMQIAADAGVAPPIRHLDADAGVVVLSFVEPQPLAHFPGGPPALAIAAAELLARLHRTTPFPVRGDHLDNLASVLVHLEQSGRVAPGLLDAHAAGFERIRAAYPWQPETFVSAHNDPNESNLLFDGHRLWLIDWETAVRNDPFVDVATVASHAATTPELRDLLLRSWLGRDPEPIHDARLTLMTLVTQLWAGCMLLMIVVDPATPTHTDLTAMTVEGFHAAIACGDLPLGTTATMHAFAKLVLGMFVDGLTTPHVEEALRVAAAG